MMKLNNKGMTLVEIIISIALISIVLVFLFSLLVTVNDMNDEAEINSTYLINKALILKNIEEDLSGVTSIKIKACENINNVYTNYGVDANYFVQSDDNKLDDEEKTKVQKQRNASECIKIEDIDDKPAYLAIYYYKNKESYVISYIHGNVRATRELPDFEKYNVNDNGSLKNTIKLVTNNNSCEYDSFNYYCNVDNGFYKIEVPIIGSDGKDYTILISYYGTVTVE